MDPYQRILQKTYDQNIPFTAHWELTYRCNLSCIHCYATCRSGGDELSTVSVQSGLEQLAEMGCLYLTFTGGEILCRADIVAILSCARSNGFAIRLFTNGTLITAWVADELAAIEPLSVEISLYAVTSAVHDEITGVEGSHAKAVAGICLCKERGMETVIKTPLMKHNIAEYPAVSRFAKEIGSRLVFDYLLVPRDDGSRTMPEHGLTEEQVFQFVLANTEQDVDPPARPDMSAPLCGAGSNALCIDPRGDVSPCLAIRRSVGDLRTQSLKDIWRSGNLDVMRTSRRCNLPECSACEDVAYCSRCSGVALAECGDMFGRSDSACVIARATRRAAEVLRDVV